MAAIIVPGPVTPLSHESPISICSYYSYLVSSLLWQQTRYIIRDYRFPFCHTDEQYYRIVWDQWAEYANPYGPWPEIRQIGK